MSGMFGQFGKYACMIPPHLSLFADLTTHDSTYLSLRTYCIDTLHVVSIACMAIRPTHCKFCKTLLLQDMTDKDSHQSIPFPDIFHTQLSLFLRN